VIFSSIKTRPSPSSLHQIPAHMWILRPQLLLPIKARRHHTPHAQMLRQSAREGEVALPHEEHTVLRDEGDFPCFLRWLVVGFGLAVVAFDNAAFAVLGVVLVVGMALARFGCGFGHASLGEVWLL
jgi:hypothetical protein